MHLTKLEVIEYQPSWPDDFKREADLINHSLSDYLQRIHHIGSTSIVGMPAKPIIDILLEVTNLDDINIIEEKLVTLGFSKLHRSIMPYRSYITNKAGQHIQYNCHIYEMGDPEISRYCRFRDYLMEHQVDATAYANLKQSLIAEGTQSIVDYVSRKTDFVRKVDAKAKKMFSERKLPQQRLPQNKGQNIIYWSNDKIINSMIANFNMRQTYFPQYMPNVNFVRVPGYILIDLNLSDTNFNCILDNHFQKSEVQNKVDELIKYFHNKNLPFTWWISPKDTPSSLSKILIENHLKDHDDYIGLYLDLDAWYTAPLLKLGSIKLLETTSDIISLIHSLPEGHEELKEYLYLISDIYNDNDPIKLFASYINARLAGCNLLVLYAQIAGIYPLFSSDGYKDMLKHDTENFLLNHAKKIGYHLATLQVFHHELPMYLARGFKEIGKFKTLVGK
jgi:GrpB-like predicted nucleotidyltransferase (UPF0157 family)